MNWQASLDSSNSTTQQAEQKAGPLDGIKVLEFAELVAGPYCGKLLADLGAEVIKIERPGFGDDARQRGPFLGDVPHPERSGLFLYLNTNKLGITLNVNLPTGKDILKRLVKGTDILIEDKPSDVLKGMGLDYERLNVVNPKLIMTSISPFGQRGPHSSYKAYHLNVYHGTGEGYILPANIEDPMQRAPVKAAGFLGDYEAGVGAATASLMAWYWRASTSLGQHIDFSKQEWGMLMPYLIVRYPSEGVSVNRVTGTYHVFGLLPCKEGYVVLQVFSEQHWQNLVKAMGDPEWTKDKKYSNMVSRAQHGKEVNQHIIAWLKNFSNKEVFQRLQEHHVICGMVNNPQDLLQTEHFRSRKFFVETEHPEVGKIEYPSVPYKFSKTPYRTVRPAPLLGQHNEEIYCQRLGYSKQDLVRLRGTGII